MNCCGFNNPWLLPGEKGDIFLISPVRSLCATASYCYDRYLLTGENITAVSVLTGVGSVPKTGSVTEVGVSRTVSFLS